MRTMNTRPGDFQAMSVVCGRPVGVLLICLLLAVNGAAGFGQQDSRLVIVVNPRTPLTQVGLKELKELYLGEISRLGGHEMVPVNHAAHTPIRLAFEKQVLRMNADEFAQHWKARRFLDTSQKQPTVFRSVESVKTFVAAEKGAIGYLPYSATDASVLVIRKVDNIDLTAKEYPLMTR